MKRKICVVTGTRAEYGLLSHLMKEIQRDEALELQIIATGTHLSPEFGLTWKEIEKDGFVISAKVEMLLSADTSPGIAKSMGLGMIGLADVFERLNPDMVLVLGDRFEIFSAVSVAHVARIPVAHIHGGEVTEGAFDDAFRHAITKMSYLHFVSTEEYRKRVIQLGESPERVFNVGALGVENIQMMSLLPQEKFEETIGFSLGKRSMLVTFHPVTLEDDTAAKQFGELLSALDELDEFRIIFTKPNADTHGRVINLMIDHYVRKNFHRAIVFTSMGQLLYLSAMQCVDVVVGNSSSGIIEAPSFNVATINIGDRQKGRVRAESVLDCKPTKESILSAFVWLSSKDFQSKRLNITNTYSKKNSAQTIIELLKKEKIFSGILKKKFYDVT